MTAERPSWLIYAMPSMHQDISYMKSAEEDLDLFVSEYLKYLDMMDREPTWCYSSEFAYAVRYFLEQHPEQKDRLTRHVRAGRFGITAQCSGYDPSFYTGEFILRGVAVAKEWLRRTFGYEPRTLDLADCPDWSPQFPQILKGCEVDLLLCDRMGTGEGYGGGVLDIGEFPGLWERLDNEVLQQGIVSRMGFDRANGELAALYPGYWEWKREHKDDQPVMRLWHHVGLDGTSVLAYAPGLRYFALHGLQRPAGQKPRNRLDNEEVFLSNLNPELDPAGVALGVVGFDEEAVDVERVVDAIAEWNRTQATARGIELRLCTAEPFTQRMVQAVASGEVRPGRYSGITPGWGFTLHDNADMVLTQYQLPAAEMLASFNRLLGRAPYPVRALDHAWEILWQVSHNQRGDPSFLQAARSSARATAGLLQRGMSQLTASVKPARAGQPILVFNPLNWERAERVQVTLPAASIAGIVDGAGRAVPSKVLSTVTPTEGATQSVVEFVAEGVPGLGYRTFYVEGAADSRGDLACGDRWIENSFLRVEVDVAGYVHVLDRARGCEVCGESAACGPLRLVGQGQKGELSWQALEPAVTCGPTRAALAVRGILSRAPAAITFTLTPGSPRVSLDVDLDWNGERGVNLYLPLPFAFDPGELRLGVACGHAPYLRPTSPAVLRATPLSKRSARSGFSTHWWMPMPHLPIPGDEFSWAYFQRWAYLGTKSGGVVLASVRREGMVVGDGVLAIPLLSTPVKRVRWHRLPNIFSVGSHHWALALTTVSDVAQAPRFGFEVSQPLLVTAAWRPGGTLADAQSLVRLGCEQAIFMALKRSFDGRGWVLRCFESQDEDTELQVQFSEALGLSAAQCCTTNLLEREATLVETGPTGLHTPLRGFEIKTLRFERRR
jgi:hypothetical protein